METQKLTIDGMNPYAHGIRFRNREDFFPQGYTPEELEQVYFRLTSGRLGGYAILESPSFDDVDEFYNPGLYDVDNQFILEAVVVDKFSRTETRMKALSRALGKYLSQETADGETISAMPPVIGKPKKAGTFAYVTVQIPFSDGQSISIVFHSPEGDKKKIGPDDQIIAFRWLLNKRDITHVVAPENGADVSLETIGKRMAQLIYKNHAHFVATQKDSVAEQKKLDGLKVQAEALDADNTTLSQQLTGNASEADKSRIAITNTQARIEQQKDFNAKLEADIAALKAHKAARVEPEVTNGDDKFSQELKISQEAANLTPEQAKALRKNSQGIQDGYGNLMQVTMHLKDFSDVFYLKLSKLNSVEEKWNFLNNTGVDVSTKIGNNSFRDKVDLNGARREGKKFTYFELSPRKGYVLATFYIDLAGKVSDTEQPETSEKTYTIAEVSAAMDKVQEYDRKVMSLKDTGGKLWYGDPDVYKPINYGAKMGWLYRPSTTQVHWTDAGIAAYKAYSQQPEPGGVDTVDGEIIKDGKFSGFKMVSQKALGVNSPMVNIYGLQGKVIGVVHRDDLDKFIAGDGKMLQPKGGWQSEFSNELKEKLGLTSTIIPDIAKEKAIPFQMSGDVIRDYQSGMPMTGDYEGLVNVIKDGQGTVMKTWIENGERNWSMPDDSAQPEPTQETPKLAPAPEQNGNPAKRTAKILYHHGLEERVMGADDFIVRIEPKEGPNLVIEKAGMSLTIEHLIKRNGKVITDQGIVFTMDGNGLLNIDSTAMMGPNGMIRGKDLTMAQVFTKSLVEQGMAKSGILKEGRGLVDDAETVPGGWGESTPGGMITNNDPVNGGIIDKEIVSGEWFVIPNDDSIEKMTGFNSREDAYAALADAVNAKSVKVEPQPATKLPAEMTISELTPYVQKVKPFMGNSQLQEMANGLRGEEKSYFKEKFVEMANIIDTMPKTYEQDGKGNDAVVYLHYFKGGSDWYIIEKDMEPEQIQAFGLADPFGDGGEVGYISIEEITKAGAELDLHWSNKTIGEIKGINKPSEPEPEPTSTVNPNETHALEILHSIINGEITDTVEVDQKLDEAATLLEQIDKMDVYDTELNAAADKLSALLADKAKEVK